jgi:MFS family permease
MREFSSAHWRRVAAEEPDPAEVRRNSRLLILNGGLVFMSMTLASSDMLLPAFVQSLTTSSVAIGLAGALMRIGWAWPQVFISRIIENRKRKMPFLLLAGGMRSIVWLVIAGLTYLMGGRQPFLFLCCFMVLYAISTSMMGIWNVPWMDIVGKVVPPGDRSRLFAVRRLCGGITAMVAGGAISFVLSDRSGISFPSNYAALFMLSGLGNALSVFVFSRIREPVRPVRYLRQPLSVYLNSGIRLLKNDVNYRRLCGMQILWSFLMMGAPFYVPYAITDLGLGLVYVGVLVSVMQVSTVLSNVLWASVGHRKGNRAMLVYGSYLMALSVAVPLLASYVPSHSIAPLSDWGIEWALNPQVVFFALTFVLSGFASSAMFNGRMAYVLELAPENRRPTYTSFLNMFALPQGFLPVLAGMLVAWISYRPMFWIALLFVPPTVFYVHRLADLGRQRSG